MLEYKGLPFEEVNVDLGRKPPHFSETYAAISLDAEARAKAPILEVGFLGEPGHVRLIESEVVARYLEDAFPSPPMQPADPARRALGNLFAATFTELLANTYNVCLGAKSQKGVDQAMVAIRRGLFAVEQGLARYGSSQGPFFEGSELGIVEALTAPFVVRMLINMKHHRGVDVLAMQDLPRAGKWMKAICDHPAITNTLPSDKSLLAIPPFLEPFFKTHCSQESVAAVPTSAAAAEAAFAATVDTGLIHKGRAPRDRSAGDAKPRL